MKRILSARLLLAAGLLAGAARAASAQSGDVVVAVNTTWPEATYNITSLTVTSGATLTVAGGSTINVSGAVTLTGSSTILLQGKNTTGQVNGAWQGLGVTISAVSAQVDAGSRISADGQGYTTAQGPGGTVDYTVGGTYGGVGYGATASTYGSYLSPTDLGSAGGQAWGGWSAGGGAIRLVVSGTLTNNGTISANGLSGSGGNAAGAAGGSVYVTAGTLAGSGVVTANGGVGSGSNATGGGGRVAIYYGVNSGFDLEQVTASGGGTGAAAGSVYLLAANTDLHVTRELAFPQDTNATYGRITVSNGAQLKVGGGSSLVVTGALEVTQSSTILLQGKNTTGQVNGAWQGLGVTISAVSAQVDAGSRISADGQGYTTAQGPGGTVDYTVGGTYGGVGYGATASTYGSYLSPTDLGSAGGQAWGGWSAGGGAIRLVVSGTLTNNGTISANGLSGSGGNAAGAAGGSVYVTAGTLAGSGVVTANGGVGSGSNATGGGGRVAIYYGVNSGFDLEQVTASGGGTGAAAGSVYLLAANTDLHVTRNLILPKDTTASYGSVTVSNGAVLALGGGSSLVVTQSLVVTETSTVLVQAKDNTASVNGTWQGAGATIHAASVQVDSGSRISADNQGYTTGQGPGGSVAYTVGGTYGGVGYGATASVYGSYSSPTDLGSAGGHAWGGWSAGGGAIRLVVSGTLTNNGTISANGLSGAGGNAAGAAGGSVYVTVGTLAGSGSFAANGSVGAGSNATGGGGRVAIYYTHNDGFDLNLVTASGGGVGAAAGSVYLLANNSDLFVTSHLVLPPDASASYGNVTVSNGALLALGGGSTVVVTGLLHVTGASTLRVQSKNTTGQVGGSWQGVGAAIAAGSARIDAGCSIDADGQGYTTAKGPGGSVAYSVGGTHGGVGSSASAATYGSALAPSDLGSAGGGASGGWSAGGGALRLTVSGTLINDGTISADGQSGGGNNAGASGGSLYITAGAISGSGTFSANGNAGSNANGGGGRVAIYYTAGTVAPTAVTANAGGANATAGTIAFQVRTEASPLGASYSVDSQSFTSAQTLQWLVGDTHTLTTTATQAGSGGAWYVFRDWSDAGALSHTVTASLATASYAAAFDTRYQLSVQPALLRIGVVRNSVTGAAQEVTLTQSGTAPVSWSATTDHSWLLVSPASGAGPARLSVRVNPADPGLQALGTVTGHVTVSSSAALSALAVDVVVTVSAQNTTSPPFGQVDTPAQNATGIVGAIGVTGWALDDVGVTRVRVYRNCLDFENQVSCQTIEGNRVVFIGDAAFLAGARPDVEAAFPSHPHGYRAGWGYLMLTNMLPHVSKSAGYGGQGQLTIYAFASDAEGQTTLLGRSRLDHTPTTITLANDGIAKPFGAIDTPGQGQTVSGPVANFGWALTPDSNAVAGSGDILIPTDGSTMRVIIDGAAVGTVTYNQCRGNVGNPVPAGSYCNDDVASIFGNPTPQPTFTKRESNPTRHRNLDDGRSAIGSFDIDTARLANGLHTIAWGVIDSAGRAEGIGSRFFIVLNGGSTDTLGADARASSASEGAAPAVRGDAARLDDLAVSTTEVKVRTGFDFDGPLEHLPLDADGIRRVRLPELGRLELVLGPVEAAYLVANGTLRDLPAGSRLDPENGEFTWLPAVGYVGTYRLVFVRGREQVAVLVTIRPVAGATPGESELRMFVDSPRPGETVAGRLLVAGWALDPQASAGSGIGAVHVWARRCDTPGSEPVFLGAAELDGPRPDVGQAFGAQFGRAGYGLATAQLGPGRYDITVYAWNRRTARWEDARTVRVHVR